MKKSPKKSRLTDPQKKLLSGLAVRHMWLIESYPPGVALVRLGLARRGNSTWGYSTLRITEAGRKENDKRRVLESWTERRIREDEQLK